MSKKSAKERLNTIRLNILMKGYATITDIRLFIPCGTKKAKDIYEKEAKTAMKEGKTTCKGISSKRLLKYVDLTIEEIKKYANDEKGTEFLK